jgi:Winged helix-turn-helix DNA-binding
MVSRGTTQQSSAPYNRRIVLDVIRRQGTISRKEIVDLVSLSPQTVANITNDLETIGLIVAKRLTGGSTMQCAREVGAFQGRSPQPSSAKRSINGIRMSEVALLIPMVLPSKLPSRPAPLRCTRCPKHPSRCFAARSAWPAVDFAPTAAGHPGYQT